MFQLGLLLLFWKEVTAMKLDQTSLIHVLSATHCLCLILVWVGPGQAAGDDVSLCESMYSV